MPFVTPPAFELFLAGILRDTLLVREQRRLRLTRAPALPGAIGSRLVVYDGLRIGVYEEHPDPWPPTA